MKAERKQLATDFFYQLPQNLFNGFSVFLMSVFAEKLIELQAFKRRNC